MAAVFFEGADALPRRIRLALEDAGLTTEDVVGGLKTGYKPNATIPVLWLVILDRRLLLCSTHKRRGIYEDYSPQTVNLVKVERSPFGNYVLQILAPELGADDLEIPLSRDITAADVSALMQAAEQAGFKTRPVPPR